MAPGADLSTLPSMLLNASTLAFIESAPVPVAAAWNVLLLTLAATCWQNLPPPVATTCDGVSLGGAAAPVDAAAAAAAVEALAVFFFAAQPLSKPTTVS